MREIKFRAWDELNKLMHHEVEFIRSGTENNDWIIFKSDKQKLADRHVFNNPYLQQQVKLMQYTGLHDKNGKEIYEGDIVRVSPENPVIYQVISQIGLGRFELLDLELKDFRGISWINKFEVIGNIYENPELLK